ncbi:hypothetical protein HK097_002516 [Rhizophlyctis rosea]|uniref:Uncharacterized protein n=1 Tax=Rhizophlyctis rosea TaxID=64517 RepID=A0AAD5X0L8_9FUNG|nr:hypothetical protein HK097_002516 [Rhizophlyctis rosea]
MFNRWTITAWESIRRRNEMLVNGKQTVKDPKDRGLELLDAFTHRTYLPHLAEQYFRSFPTFELAVSFLCKWATAVERERECRVLLAITLLRHAVGDEGNTLGKEQVQAHLLQWFDGEMEFGAEEGIVVVASPAPVFAINILNLSATESASRCRFVGDLIDAGIFNYGIFLQRLIARGDLEGARRDTEVGLTRLRKSCEFFDSKADVSEIATIPPPHSKPASRRCVGPSVESKENTIVWV